MPQENELPQQGQDQASVQRTRPRHPHGTQHELMPTIAILALLVGLLLPALGRARQHARQQLSDQQMQALVVTDSSKTIENLRDEMDEQIKLRSEIYAQGELSRTDKENFKRWQNSFAEVLGEQPAEVRQALLDHLEVLKTQGTANEASVPQEVQDAALKAIDEITGIVRAPARGR